MRTVPERLPATAQRCTVWHITHDHINEQCKVLCTVYVYVYVAVRLASRYHNKCYNYRRGPLGVELPVPMPESPLLTKRHNI